MYRERLDRALVLGMWYHYLSQSQARARGTVHRRIILYAWTACTARACTRACRRLPRVYIMERHAPAYLSVLHARRLGGAFPREDPRGLSRRWCPRGFPVISGPRARFDLRKIGRRTIEGATERNYVILQYIDSAHRELNQLRENNKIDRAARVQHNGIAPFVNGHGKIALARDDLERNPARLLSNNNKSKRTFRSARDRGVASSRRSSTRERERERKEDPLHGEQAEERINPLSLSSFPFSPISASAIHPSAPYYLFHPTAVASAAAPYEQFVSRCGEQCLYPSVYRRCAVCPLPAASSHDLVKDTRRSLSRLRS